MTDRMSQLRNMLESEPDDAFCLYGIAMEYAKAGQTDRAIAHFDRTIEVQATLRKAYGFGSLAMSMVSFDGQTISVALPGVTLGAMGARGAGDAVRADDDTAEQSSVADTCLSRGCQTRQLEACVRPGFAEFKTRFADVTQPTVWILLQAPPEQKPQASGR